MKTKLSNQEKKEIIDNRDEALIDEEEWARLQGMTHSEILQDSKKKRDEKSES
jgi:hypothetical protein